MTGKIKWGPGPIKMRYTDDEITITMNKLSSEDDKGNVIVEIGITSLTKTDDGKDITVNQIKKVIRAIYDKQKKDNSGYYILS